MRKEFSNWAIQNGQKDPSFIFLTGDLGYNALEGVRETLGSRFVNAGVSEQNMITMAAALASQGLNPFCYSIAPFCVYRPAEQVRVDVCLHNMNVKIVGNGGGYGYGIMGATHHALEDIAVLSGFQNMKCFIPFCNQAVASVCDAMNVYKGPSYLRLGFGVAPQDLQFAEYAPMQQLLTGQKLTIVGMGPVLLNAISGLSETKMRADVFCVNEIPLEKMSNDFMKSIAKTERLLIVEEHVTRGGLGEHISLLLLRNSDVKLKKIVHVSANGYPTKRYGSQSYHQVQCGLDRESLKQVIIEISL